MKNLNRFLPGALRLTLALVCLIGIQPSQLLAQTKSAKKSSTVKKPKPAPAAPAPQAETAEKPTEPVAEKIIMPDKLAPIYVTTRVFQMRTSVDNTEKPTDQVFKVNTAGQVDEAKWLTSLKKAYPGFEPALLQTVERRVFRTSKPQQFYLASGPNANLQIELYGAQSPGDGTTPGTVIVPEITMVFGRNNTVKPVAYGIQTLEVESGKTYFFTPTSLAMKGQDYVSFFRHHMPVETFAKDLHYLVFAFSVEMEKPSLSFRRLADSDKSLMEKATKKVQPETPEALKNSKLQGAVQVLVEIDATGKVTFASTHTSSYPEMNSAAVAAARQWEFPAAIVAEHNQPVRGLLTFNLP